MIKNMWHLKVQIADITLVVSVEYVTDSYRSWEHTEFGIYLNPDNHPDIIPAI